MHEFLASVGRGTGRQIFPKKKKRLLKPLQTGISFFSPLPSSPTSTGLWSRLLPRLNVLGNCVYVGEKAQKEGKGGVFFFPGGWWWLTGCSRLKKTCARP